MPSSSRTYLLPAVQFAEPDDLPAPAGRTSRAAFLAEMNCLPAIGCSPFGRKMRKNVGYRQIK
jgi:hypothetical protein